MSTSSLSYARRRTLVWSRLADYVELTKPKIAALELLTVVVGACVASSGLPADGWRLANLLLGTALVAASASALNQWIERRTDLLMKRTAQRPLPSGRLSASEVLLFGAVTGLGGVMYLALTVGLLTAALGLLTWLLYVAIYTPLKRRSTANTFVGAVAGGLPVLMGSAAFAHFESSTDMLVAATLFLIVFLWQFPHFMAIAWLYRDSYSAADMKMLPVVDPSGRRAGAQAVLSALLLVPISLLPSVLLRAGSGYFSLVLLLSLWQLAFAVMFALRLDDLSARRLLRASLVYLPSLWALLLVVPLVFPRL